jgi:hypothetical protein
MKFKWKIKKKLKERKIGILRKRKEIKFKRNEKIKEKKIILKKKN